MGFYCGHPDIPKQTDNWKKWMVKTFWIWSNHCPKLLWQESLVSFCYIPNQKIIEHVDSLHGTPYKHFSEVIWKWLQLYTLSLGGKFDRDEWVFYCGLFLLKTTIKKRQLTFLFSISIFFIEQKEQQQQQQAFSFIYDFFNRKKTNKNKTVSGWNEFSIFFNWRQQ